MLLHPNKRLKLKKKILNTFPKDIDEISSAKLADMNYLNYFVKEILRFDHPVFLNSQRAFEQVDIDGITIL